MQANNVCSYPAAEYTPLTVAEIESYNANTWGFLGCGNLQIGQYICLRSGIPPFLVPVTNAFCGPQVPGTTAPLGSNTTDWALLNLCPLNACCDIWGQCGEDPAFCPATECSTDAPGTAAPKTNRCISNCGIGVEVVAGPAEIAPIGYFAVLNSQRSCLNMDIHPVNVLDYTHSYYAVRNITEDFNIDNRGFSDHFAPITYLKHTNRIISFGG